MEDTNKHIDDLFRDGLGDYTETPPPAVWDALEQRLDNNQRRKRFPIWWWYVLVFVLVSVGVMVAKMANDNKEPDNNKAKQQVNKELNTAVYKTNKATDSSNIPTAVPAPAHTANNRNKVINKTVVNVTEGGKHKPVKKGNIKVRKARSTQHIYSSHRVRTTSKLHKKNSVAPSGANNVASSKSVKRGKTIQPSVNSVVAPAGIKAVNSGKKAVKTNKKAIANTSVPALVKTGKKQSKPDTVAASNNNAKTVVPATTNKTAQVKTGKKRNKNNAVVNSKSKHTTVNSTAKTISQKPARVVVNEPKTTKETSNVTKPNPVIPKASTAKKTTNKASSITSKPQPIAATPAITKATPITPKTAPVKKKNNKINGIAANPKPVKISPAPPKAKSVAVTPAKPTAALPINPEASTAKKKSVTTSAATFKNKKTEKQSTSEKEVAPVVNNKNIGGTFKNVTPQQPEKFSREGIPVNTYAPAVLPQAKAAMLAKAKSKEPDFLAINTMDPNSGGGGGAAGGNDNGEAVLPAQQKNKINRWSAGIKAGYEKGFGQYEADKYIIEPFLQYNISSRVSVLLQPGIKPAHVNTTVIDSRASYFKYNNPLPTQNFNYITDTSGTIDSVQRNYIYNGSYDSFAIGHYINKTYLEMELPILVQIKLSKGLSFQGGVSLQYSKILSIQTDSFSTTINPPSYTLSYPTVPASALAPTPPDISTIFPHTTQSYNNYNATIYQNSPYNPLRFGYMIGFSYSLWDRLLLDIMVQQSLTNITYLNNQNIRNIYNQPYLRFTIGYKFIKSSF